ncbi:MAG: hypothetical protein GY756_05460 [bacterium]|nr:hypothetical protein [bacterium]
MESKELLTPIKEIITDITEMGVDQIISDIFTEDTIVEKLPIIKWLHLGGKIQSCIQNAHFIKKYSYFISTINQSITPDDFNNLLENLKKEKNQKRLIENIVLDIDRFRTNQKAVLLGELFDKTFHENVFTMDEYNRLRYSIDLMHPYDGISCLAKFYQISITLKNFSTEDRGKTPFENERVDLDFSPLTATSLLRLPKGGAVCGSIGGAYINALGRKFYEEVVLSVIDSLDIDE